MKTFLTTAIAILVFTITCKAQWTAGTGVITTFNNVGIGTSTPGVPLDLLQNTTTIYSSSGTLPPFVFRNNNQSNIAGVSALQAFSALDGSGQNNQWYMGLASSAASFAGVFAIGNRDGSTSYAERFRITGTGNVGIGTTTPDQKLTVNGTVHSKAVVVDNNIFPDYVFKKTYALRPLSAVKAYIDLNHHLPEMPSAAEVEKNGQNLGEMNTLLLKKVEELTLYLIELNKVVKQQQTKIERLEKNAK